MDYLYAIIEILAGIGTFMLGFKLLSENMEKYAGNSLKKLFNKTSNNKFVGVGMGAVATAVVQSSAVTTVMVVGFVNAGIMTLNQAAAIIMGANIGTTITAQIVALQSFNIKLMFMIFAFVGIALLMFGRREKQKQLGLVLAGFGLVFVGFFVMEAGIDFVKELDSVKRVLAAIDNPFLLLLIGAFLTALIQSSGAVTAIIIGMAGSGMLIGGGGNAFLYVILGSNIGTCVTALLSSKGTSVNARRAGIIHLLFNVIGSLFFMILLLCMPGFQAKVLQKIFPELTTQIAMFHTFFNIVCTLLFLPFTKLLVKAATLLVPDGKTGGGETSFMDKRFLANPALAISQLKKETFRMADKAMECFNTSYTAFIDKDTEAAEKVASEGEDVARLSDEICNYLVRVSASGLSLTDERKVSALHNNVGDIMRIAEFADNFVKYTRRTANEGLVFSDTVKEQLNEMHGLLKDQFALVKAIILDKDYGLLTKSDELEDRIDNMRREIIAGHIARMERGECKPESNAVFVNLVSNMERLGDHLGYIAHSMDNIYIV